MSVVCLEGEGKNFCLRGKCEQGTISCDCSDTGFYGDRCEKTSQPERIEVTSNHTLRNRTHHKFLGLFDVDKDEKQAGAELGQAQYKIG